MQSVHLRFAQMKRLLCSRVMAQRAITSLRRAQRAIAEGNGRLNSASILSVEKNICNFGNAKYIAKLHYHNYQTKY